MPEQQKPRELALDSLKEAVRSAAALRLRAKLGGVGGDGDKVFPATYVGGVYAVEDRRIDGKVVRCVLLDSVQSQANRMEDALLDAFLPTWRELDPKVDGADGVVRSDLPILAVHIENHGWVTSLTAPHRIHDAIIRDSEIEETVNGEPEKVRFRESTIGKQIVAARINDAAAFYKHCPTALIFGTWDSTSGEGLNSAKVPRAVVSEIVGVDITAGVRTASRIDPLGIRASSATVYRLKSDKNDWTLDDSEAAESKPGQNEPFGKGKPSDINHGNVTPDIATKPGGVTMAYALHTWTLSLTQLRRLRFPSKPLDERDQQVIARNEAARTVLAALALYALALQQETGYWLRSRCELAPENQLVLEQIGGGEGLFSLGTAAEARKILDEAIKEAAQLGLEWSKLVTVLTPTKKLQMLVGCSDSLGPDSEAEQETASAGAAG